MAGVSPLEDLTPRELLYMAETRTEKDWLHTSCILAMLHNTVSKRPKKPEDFNPLKKKNSSVGGKRVTLGDFKAVLTKRKKADK